MKYRLAVPPTSNVRPPTAFSHTSRTGLPTARSTTRLGTGLRCEPSGDPPHSAGCSSTSLIGAIISSERERRALRDSLRAGPAGGVLGHGRLRPGVSLASPRQEQRLCRGEGQDLGQYVERERRGRGGVREPRQRPGREYREHRREGKEGRLRRPGHWDDREE